jgi:hypothetical protein
MNVVSLRRMNCLGLALEEAVALEVVPEVEVAIVFWQVQ